MTEGAPRDAEDKPDDKPDELPLSRQVAALRAEWANARGYMERLAVSSERATNIAEGASERILNALAQFSQIESALKIAMVAMGHIKELEEANSRAQIELRKVIDTMRDDISQMKEEVFVALGRSTAAEEIATEAKAEAQRAAKSAHAAQSLQNVAEEAKQHAFEARKAVAAAVRRLDKLDEQIAAATTEQLGELKRFRQQSETDMREQAKAGVELARLHVEQERERQLAEIELDRVREENARKARVEELAIKREAAQQRWDLAKRIMGPTGVVAALIALFIAIVGKC